MQFPHKHVQGWAKKLVPGSMNFVPDVNYHKPQKPQSFWDVLIKSKFTVTRDVTTFLQMGPHFCLNLLATFSQPRANFLAQPCTSITFTSSRQSRSHLVTARVSKTGVHGLDHRTAWAPAWFRRLSCTASSRWAGTSPPPCNNHQLKWAATWCPSPPIFHPLAELENYSF